MPLKFKVNWKNISPVRSLCSVLVILIIIALILAIVTAIHNHKKSQSHSKHHPDPSSPVMSPSSSFLDSLLQSNAVNQKSKGFFIMGDSSVDCGLNTLFYPVLRRNLSLFPCSNGDDSSLIPYFLGNSSIFSIEFIHDFQFIDTFLWVFSIFLGMLYL